MAAVKVVSATKEEEETDRKVPKTPSRENYITA
jgi:hypothetical protein